MQAEVGDQLVMQRRRASYGELVGSVVEVLNDDGNPPYVIKWYSDGHESVLSPDPANFRIRGHRNKALAQPE
jgi:hypothetical protein